MSTLKNFLTKKLEQKETLILTDHTELITESGLKEEAFSTSDVLPALSHQNYIGKKLNI